jgi:short-subunit dehydrogenase
LQETKTLAGELSNKISIHVVNIADREAVEALVAEVIEAQGSVDGVINDAGIIQPFVRLVNLTYPQIDKVMNVNFYGTLYMTKAFLPELLKRPEAHIVNVSSMGGFLPVPGQSLYGASKAAVKLLTEGLLNTNVQVSVVFPGAISTNISVNSGIMTQEQQSKMDTGTIKMTAPDVAAQIIIDGMEKNKYRILVGNDSKMMDFLTRLAPKQAANFIYNQMKSLLP